LAASPPRRAAYRWKNSDSRVRRAWSHRLAFAETADISQLLQLDVQDKLQKQQQFVQTISNIMKNEHDTLKAIIQNLRG
jgi:hypothetical protein